MNKEDLKAYVLNNPSLVSMKPAGEGMYVLKYKKKVFFDNLWNEYLEECRGTIVDEDFNIISYPFTKIYNYGVEDKAPVLDPSTPVTAYRKVNGFMAAVTWCYKTNDILISTTGSTDSDYVVYIREMIGDNIDMYRSVMIKNSWYTYLFECCHPSDPHIVPEETGMYLLGIRRKEYGSKVEVGDYLNDQASFLNCKVPEMCKVTMEVLMDLSSKVHHEGFVFYTDDGQSAKIKSPYYLVNKFVARCNNTDKLMRKDIKKNIDEEYYPLIDKIQENIGEFTAMDEQSRLDWCRKVLTKD